MTTTNTEAAVRRDELPKLAPTAWQLFFKRPYRTEEQETWFERRFFASLRLRSGVFKSTDAGRMPELDELVTQHLPRDRSLTLMDVAISSGVTTADWMRHLDASCIEHRMVASDLCIEAWLLSMGERIHVLVDRSGYPLQYDVFGRGVRTSSARAAVDLPLALLRRCVKGLTRLHGRWRGCRGELRPNDALSALCAAETVHDGFWGVRRVLLISGQLAGRGNLLLLEEDLLTPPSPELVGVFDAVRAANILSRSYFSDEQLRAMIANLRVRLVPGGLFVVCRTEDDGTNNATIFRLGKDGGFEVVDKLGNGADVKNLVVAWG